MRTFVVSYPTCTEPHPGVETDCAYRVAWAINPHMRIGQTCARRAAAQHQGLVRALRRAGAVVRHVPFVHGAFDSVFMKDSMILASRAGSRAALPATFRCTERAVEPAARTRELAALGFAVAQPLAAPLEGGDLCIVEHRRLALLGHGVRSSRDSAAGLAAFLRYDVVPLELRDPALFHLDTALSVLPDDTLLYCADAFTPAAVAALRSLRFARTREVPAAIARAFGVNVVAAGRAVVTGTWSAEIAALWRELGIPAEYAPLDQFQLAGGSAACLVAEVHELDAEPARLALAA